MAKPPLPPAYGSSGITADGTESMTADWDFGGYDLYNVETLAVGNAASAVATSALQVKGTGDTYLTVTTDTSNSAGIYFEEDTTNRYELEMDGADNSFKLKTVANVILQAGYNSANAMLCPSGGNVLIGSTTDRSGKLQVVSSTIAIEMRDVDTDNNNKTSRLGTTAYVNAQAPVANFVTTSLVSSNVVIFGGGTGSMQAATSVRFNTAAAVNIATGTERMQINSAGNVLIGSTTDLGAKLQVVGTVGQWIEVTDSVANETDTKRGGLAVTHFTNAEEPFGLIYGTSGTSATKVYVGGGSANYNACEQLSLMAAATDTTTTGIEIVRVTTAGMMVAPAGVAGAASNALHVIGTAATYAAHVHNDTASAGCDGLLIRVDDNSASTDALSVTQGAGFTRLLEVKANGTVVIGNTSASGKLHVDQATSDAAVPVLYLDQADVSEEFIKFVGDSGNGVDTNSFVDAADYGTPGTLTGWIKIEIDDVQSTGPITDGTYYIPFYTVPTA